MQNGDMKCLLFCITIKIDTKIERHRFTLILRNSSDSFRLFFDLNKTSYLIFVASFTFFDILLYFLRSFFHS